jgi:hypothetical protein
MGIFIRMRIRGGECSVASVSLTVLGLVFCLEAAVHAEGAAHIVAFLEATLAVASDIPLVPLMGLDEFAFRAHASASHRTGRAAA